MPVAVFRAQAAVTMMNRAFIDISPTFDIYANQVSMAGTSPESIKAFANAFGASFASLSDSQLAFKVLDNMGLLPNTELFLGLIEYFATNASARGLVVLQIVQILAEQESAIGAMAKYAAAAAAWNTEVMNSHMFSTNPANATVSYSEWFPDLLYVRYSAERTLANAIANNDRATAPVNTLIAAAAMRSEAKTKADANDAVALAATGNTTAATAAAADDAALVKVTQVFDYALSMAIDSANYAEGIANTAVTWADAFVDFAASTLTNQEDDTAAAAIKTQASTQLAAANAVAAMVEVIAASAAPSSAPYVTASVAHAPAHATDEAQAVDVVPDHAVTLVGLVEVQVEQLL